MFTHLSIYTLSDMLRKVVVVVARHIPGEDITRDNILQLVGSEISMMYDVMQKVEEEEPLQDRGSNTRKQYHKTSH